jgi:hypothetical protein
MPSTGAQEAPKKGPGRRLWRKGESGNPKGRAKGSRPAVLVALDQIGDLNAEQIVRKCIAKAIEGDPHAMELILRRVWPPIRGGRAVNVDLPALAKSDDLAGALATVIAKVACGQLSPEDGEVFTTMLEGLRRLYESGDHEQRIASLEASRAQREGRRRST